MYDSIRNLIAENELSAAFTEAGRLSLTDAQRNQLLAYRRRWSELEENRLADTEHFDVLRVEQNKLTADLLDWLDLLEDQPAPPPHPPVPKRNYSRLIVMAAMVGLILVSWVMWRQNSASPQRLDPRELLETQTPERPQASESATTAPEKQPPTPAITSQDNIAIAVYRARKSPTAFDPDLSADVGRMLQKWGYTNASANLLPTGFHTSEIREQLQFRGKTNQPGFMQRIDARYLILVDLRGYSSSNKVADFRIALYDGEIDKGYTRGLSLRLDEQTTLLNEEFYAKLRQYLVYVRDQWDANIPAPQ